jgi:uncharacterized protein (DUF3820 family)
MRSKRNKKNRQKTLASFRLGFGRYGNTPLASVPRDYLGWILSPDFRGDIAAQWVVKQYMAQGDQSRRSGK